MSGDEDTPRRHARFPYVAAALCAACLAAAVWTWMRYSYRWGLLTVLPHDVAPGRWPDGAYVDVRVEPPLYPVVREDGSAVCGWWDETKKTWLYARPEPGDLTAGYSTTGRVEIAPVCETWGHEACVNTKAGRWTGASIAGLAVGAMGVFVFAVAFRHWLGERRAVDEETRS